ncbi:MAG: HAD-IIIA family hydrolase [Flavobacteriaceae bacterium]|jgi:3-deoxy-D-manno-octulosonate 8-phosphate phosphatase (KDO 8-P phosphatase)|nr:HAD-IIIA family hydrolase [Flavobacteriaceae bacterium]NVJ88397.1 HAD-IIIA family hydrolase [Flavobacteriaceae bacterium]
MSYKEYLHKIDTFIFDVDGVFTDGTVQISEQGQLLRTVSVKDGYAVKQALNLGYTICLISGGTDPGVQKRFAALGVEHIYLGASYKMEAFEDFIHKTGTKPENILYMGDDIPDIPPLKAVGLATCPQDAVPEVKELSHYISHRIGGDECVRDVIEQVLKVRGDWPPAYDAKND